MGFTIFESSGIFNPSDYGLNIRDMLHLIVVGGGGGGCGVSNNYGPGNPGGASSFGSILTAEGGLAPSDKNAVTPTAGSFRGAPGVTGHVGVYYDPNNGMKVIDLSSYGGGGADGWLPGVFKGRPGLSSTQFAYSSHLEKPMTGSSKWEWGGPMQDVYGHTAIFGYADALISVLPAGNQVAGSGGIYVDEYYSMAIGGVGGLGYGAGGGGGADAYTGVHNAGAGGNSGVIAQKDYMLTSLEPVPITVGIGGKGGTGYAGGDGANGCVAIFW